MTFFFFLQRCLAAQDALQDNAGVAKHDEVLPTKKHVWMFHQNRAACQTQTRASTKVNKETDKQGRTGGRRTTEEVLKVKTPGRRMPRLFYTHIEVVLLSCWSIIAYLVLTDFLRFLLQYCSETGHQQLKWLFRFWCQSIWGRSKSHQSQFLSRLLRLSFPTLPEIYAKTALSLVNMRL